MSKRKTPDDDDKGELAPPPPPFEDLRAHLEKLQLERKLVDLLGEAWDSDDLDGMKRRILRGVGEWAPVSWSDNYKFLKHDWDAHTRNGQDRSACRDLTGDDKEWPIKLHFASNDVRLVGPYRDSVEEVDAEECKHGIYCNYSASAGGDCSEVYRFVMEKRLDGTVRLVVRYYFGCPGEEAQEQPVMMEYVAFPRK